MTSRSGGGLLLICVVLLLLLFFVSLPGFGVETRPVSAYDAWAGPLFLLLTLLVFIGGILFLVFRSSRPGAALSAAQVQSVAAIVIVVVDTSAIGGPGPPLGPLSLGIVALLVAVLALILTSRRRI